MKKLLALCAIGIMVAGSVVAIFSDEKISLGNAKDIEEGCFKGSCAVKWYYNQ